MVEVKGGRLYLAGKLEAEVCRVRFALVVACYAALMKVTGVEPVGVAQETAWNNAWDLVQRFDFKERHWIGIEGDEYFKDFIDSNEVFVGDKKGGPTWRGVRRKMGGGSVSYFELSAESMAVFLKEYEKLGNAGQGQAWADVVTRGRT